MPSKIFYDKPDHKSYTDQKYQSINYFKGFFMKSTILWVSSVVATLTLLSGCAHYKARPLKPIYKTVPAREQTISFEYEIFDAVDCRRYLGRNLLRKGYLPIQISLTNNTNHSFRIEFGSGNVRAEDAARAVHTNTAGRAVGYGVAGLFVWPFLIPALVDGVGSAKANEELDDDFARKALHNQLVRPSRVIEGVVFVPVEYNDEDLVITAIDQETNKRYELTMIKRSLKI